MALELEVGVSNKHDTATCCNIINNNTVLTSSTAEPRLSAAPQNHQNEQTTAQQQPEHEDCDDNVNDSASGQQGLDSAPTRPCGRPDQCQHNPLSQRYNQQGYLQTQGYPEPQGYHSQEGFPPNKAYPPEGASCHHPSQTTNNQQADTNKNQPATVVFTVQRHADDNITSNCLLDSEDVVIELEGTDNQADRNAFITKVYCILLAQLLVFTIISFLCAAMDPLNKWAIDNMYLVAVFIPLCLTYAILLLWYEPKLRGTSPLGVVVLIVFTLSFTLLVAFYMSYPKTIYGTKKYDTTAVFKKVPLNIMSTYVFVILLTLAAVLINYDFTFMRSCDIAIVSIVVIFHLLVEINEHPTIVFIYHCIAAGLVGSLLITDTQTILAGKKQSLNTDMYILGAIRLFIDIVLIYFVFD